MALSDGTDVGYTRKTKFRIPSTRWGQRRVYERVSPVYLPHERKIASNVHQTTDRLPPIL
jgi:hypothetical protein